MLICDKHHILPEGKSTLLKKPNLVKVIFFKLLDMFNFIENIYISWTYNILILVKYIFIIFDTET